MAHRRVGEDLLDVILDEGDGGGHERCYAAYPGDDEADVLESCDAAVADVHERHHPSDEVEAGVHHRRGVYECRDRRRALHRVRQPDMERELSRLAHGPDEEHHQRPEQLSGVDERPADASRGVVEYHSELQRSVDVVQNQQADHQENITHASSQEGFLGSRSGTLLPEVEADEEIGAESHYLPEDEQPQEVVSEHHSEHADAEEHELPVEAVVPVLVDRVRVHVAEAEPADQEAQEGRDEKQHQADRVYPNADSDVGEAGAEFPLRAAML